MGQTKKITFPFNLNQSASSVDQKEKWAVFFGADFYNLPIDSNQEAFIFKTNKILDYIRKNLPNHKWVYQPHPNETDEYTKLNLTGFTVGEHALAEIFLSENASKVDYVFSAQSGASISAFAMGFDSAYFLEVLNDSLTPNTIISYRSYFSGMPDFCSIKSFDTQLPRRQPVDREFEGACLKELLGAIDLNKSVWFLSSDPSSAIRCGILANQLHKLQPNIKANLLIITNRRWQFVLADENIKKMFNNVEQVFTRRSWYGVKWRTFLDAIKIARKVKNWPIQSGDNLISITGGTFEENCFLSYHPDLNKILLVDNRWYDFIYNGGAEKLPSTVWRTSWGVRFFNYFIEPILGLKRSIYKEDRDGKVINILRYQSSLEKDYNKVFVLMPDRQN